MPVYRGGVRDLAFEAYLKESSEIYQSYAQAHEEKHSLELESLVKEEPIAASNKAKAKMSAILAHSRYGIDLFDARRFMDFMDIYVSKKIEEDRRNR